MSYILEAIKRLEQKRQQDGSPNILTLQRKTAQPPEKRTRWPYIGAAILFLNCATVFSMRWFIPWFHTEPPKTVSAQPAGPKDAQQTAARNEPAASPQTTAAATAPIPNENLPKPKPTPPLTAQPARPLPSIPEKPISATPPPTFKPPIPKSKPMNVYNLPENLKKTLPDLKMTVHSYDDRSPSRFAIINHQTLKEGDLVAPELKLEKIIPEGAVLNYQGYRFLLGLN